MASDRREIIGSLEGEWRDALCSKDFDRLRTLIHPQFVLIGTSSTGPFRLSRDEWLEAVSKRELVSIDLDVKEAAVFDQVMIGTIQANWVVKYLGRPLQDCVLLTDVWVHEEGRWQVVRRHSSPIPQSALAQPRPR